MAPPVIYNLSPTSGTVAGGNTVTINGTAFTGATAVSFGAAAGTAVAVVNDTQLTVAAPAGTGIVNVTVTAPDGTSNPGVYTYTPLITVLSPNGGPTAGGNTVNIFGAGLTGTTAVSFGGTAGTAIAVVNDTHITVVAPAHIAGAVSVTVSVGANVSNALSYAFTSGIALSTNRGSTGGGTTVAITGSFPSATTSNTTVRFGSTVVRPSAVTATLVTVTSPAGSGAVPVTVTTPGGTTAPASFFYISSPLLTNANGPTGPTVGASGGGSPLSLTGISLSTASGVTIGGTTVAPLVSSDNAITVATPAGTAGTGVTVSVTTGGGTVGGATFSYIGAPTIDALGIAPASGSTVGGDFVTISGTNLTYTTSVQFGSGNPAPGLSIIDDSTLVVTTPSGAAGAVDVIVSTLAGGVTEPGGFTYF